MSQALGIKEAWNAVALEERFEMIARSKAEGIVASGAFAFVMGSVAYGFDEIWLLVVAAAGAVLVMPLFASYSWRKNKPATIMAYLAVRSVARRYAYGYKISDFGVVLIFKGELEELYASEADEQLAAQKETVDFDSTRQRRKNVWLCLLRGGLVALSERPGGAKLEFLCAVAPELIVRKPLSSEDYSPRSVILESPATTGVVRKVVISSAYSGAMYVFEKQLLRLKDEDSLRRERQEQQMRARAVGNAK